jgi:hypothetical protein
MNHFFVVELGLPMCHSHFAVYNPVPVFCLCLVGVDWERITCDPVRMPLVVVEESVEEELVGVVM